MPYPPSPYVCDPTPTFYIAPWNFPPVPLELFSAATALLCLADVATPRYPMDATPFTTFPANASIEDLKGANPLGAATPCTDKTLEFGKAGDIVFHVDLLPVATNPMTAFTNIPVTFSSNPVIPLSNLNGQFTLGYTDDISLIGTTVNLGATYLLGSCPTQQAVVPVQVVCPQVSFRKVPNATVTSGGTVATPETVFTVYQNGTLTLNVCFDNNPLGAGTCGGLPPANAVAYTLSGGISLVSQSPSQIVVTGNTTGSALIEGSYTDFQGTPCEFTLRAYLNVVPCPATTEIIKPRSDSAYTILPASTDTYVSSVPAIWDDNVVGGVFSPQGVTDVVTYTAPASQISGTIKLNAVGECNGASDTTTLYVDTNNTNCPPFGGSSANTLYLTTTFIDIEADDAATWSDSDGSGSFMPLDDLGYKVRYTPAFDSGRYSTTITATQKCGGSAVNFLLYFCPTVPPVITSVEGATYTGGAVNTYTVLACGGNYFAATYRELRAIADQPVVWSAVDNTGNSLTLTATFAEAMVDISGYDTDYVAGVTIRATSLCDSGQYTECVINFV